MAAPIRPRGPVRPGELELRELRAEVRARELRENPFIPMKPMHRVGVLVGLALILFGILVTGLLTPAGVPGQVLLALTVYLGVLAAPLYLYRGSFGWMHPLVFTVFLGVLALMRALPLYLGGMESHTALPGAGRDELMDLVAYGLVLATLGQLAYFAGYFVLPSPPVMRLHFRQRSVKGLRLKGIAVVAFSLAGFLFYLQTQGGIRGHLLSWRMGRTVALSGEYYWLPLVWMGALGCLILLAVVPNILRMPWFWALCGIAVPTLFLFNGSRSAILSVIVMGVLVWMLRRRKVPVVRLAGVGFVVLLLLGALGEFRRATWRGRTTGISEFSPAAVLVRSASGELVERSTRSQALIPILARVPREVPLLMGESYLAVVTLPVPRKLWPRKPAMVERMTGRAFYGGEWGVPPGAVAEAYWNFHIPGIILVFALFGIFHKWLVKLLQTYHAEPAAYLLFVVSLWNFPEPSSPAVFLWVQTMIPLLLLYFAMGLLNVRPDWRPSGLRQARGARPLAAAGR